jgi:hypothetical protein
MAKNSVALGPYIDGIYIGRGPVADNLRQAGDIENFDILVDGTLQTRRPIVDAEVSIAQTLEPVGFYKNTTTGAVHTIYDTPVGTYAWDGTTATLITANRCAVALQYDDFLWMVNTTGVSGKWKPGSSFAGVAGMPLGVSAVIAKDRLLIAQDSINSRVHFSQVADFNLWDGAGGGFFAVNPNDGNRLTKLINFNDQVLIFKSRTIHVLSFEGNPTDGTLRLMSNKVGTPSRYTACGRENAAFTLFEGKVYIVANNSVEVVSNALTPNMEDDIPSDYPSAPPPSDKYGKFICFISENRVMVYVGGRYFVLHFTTEKPTWTRYSFGWQIGPVLEQPSTSIFNGGSSFIAGSLATGVNGARRFGAPEDAEAFNAKVTTRPVAYDLPQDFKRQHHWSIDLLFQGNIHTRLMPGTLDVLITWDDLELLTWNQLEERTYRRLGGDSGIIQQTIELNDYSRTLVRLQGAVRFRQIQYEVTFERTENVGEFYMFIPTLSDKQLVPAQTN